MLYNVQVDRLKNEVKESDAEAENGEDVSGRLAECERARVEV